MSEQNIEGRVREIFAAVLQLPPEAVVLTESERSDAKRSK